MKKDFQTELTELINKHNLEGEMRDKERWHPSLIVQCVYSWSMNKLKKA